MVSFAVITDLHYDRDVGTKLGSQASVAVAEFKRWCHEIGPDLVVDLGDTLDGTTAEQDRALLRRVACDFDGFPRPVEHVPGNHDFLTLARADLEDALGSSLRSRSFDLDGHHVVIFCPHCHYPRGVPFAATEEEIEWLRGDLAATMLPTIVFTHVGLHRRIRDRNKYGGSNPVPADWANSPAMLDILRASSTFMVVAGHDHWNAVGVQDGIVFLTVQSATESFTTHPDPAMAMCRIEIEGDHVSVDVVGHDPVFHRFRKRARERMWVYP